jgi:hypothetical protein
MSLGTEGAAGSRPEVARRSLHRLETEQKGIGEAFLIVVAHPDDELIGVAGQPEARPAEVSSDDHGR